MDDVHPIGTFAQIQELHDMGDRLRLVVLAHRRIKLIGPIQDTEEAVPGKLTWTIFFFVLK